jgi:hypothetical protein
MRTRDKEDKAKATMQEVWKTILMLRGLTVLVDA